MATPSLRLQIVGDTRSAETAIAFANQVFLRAKTAILNQPVVNYPRKIFDVGNGAVEELFASAFRDQCPAEARANGVDEDQIGKVEPRSLIVRQRRRIRRAVPFVAGFKMLRSDGAEIQVYRRGAGTAMECKGHWTVAAIDGISRIDDASCFFAFFVVTGNVPTVAV